MEIEHRIDAALPFLRNRKVAHNRDIGIHVEEVAIDHVAHHRLQVARPQHGRELFIQSQHLEFIDRILEDRTRARQGRRRLVVGQESHEGAWIMHP